MGCWCETCGITQLPINAGDKVRVFVMSSQNSYQFEDGGAGGGGTCYSNDRWAPIGPAIQGTYDDYGGVENIVMDDSARMVEAKIASGWVPLTKKHEWDDVPEKLELSDYLNYIERDRGKFKSEGRQEQHLGLMFVLEDVYQAMINFDSIEAHHNWTAHTYQYKPMSEGLKLDLQEWYEAKLELFKPRLSKDIDHLYEMMSELDLGGGRLFSDFRDNGIKIFKKPLLNCAKEQISFQNEKVQKLVSDALDMLRFEIAMSRARKQWMPQSGKGSQNNELDIYKAINAAAAKIMEERHAEDIANGMEPVDENGYTSWQREHNEKLKNKGTDAKED